MLMFFCTLTLLLALPLIRKVLFSFCQGKLRATLLCWESCSNNKRKKKKKHKGQQIETQYFEQLGKLCSNLIFPDTYQTCSQYKGQCSKITALNLGGIASGYCLQLRMKEVASSSSVCCKGTSYITFHGAVVGGVGDEDRPIHPQVTDSVPDKNNSNHIVIKVKSGLLLPI